MATDKDKQFCQIADKLIADYNLQKNKRMAITGSDNIGDFYYCVASLDYVQAKLGVTFFIICKSGSSAHQICSLFKSGGANINIIILPENLGSLYYSASPDIQKRYESIVIHFNVNTLDPHLVRWLATEDIRQNISRPKYNYHLPDLLRLNPGGGIQFLLFPIQSGMAVLTRPSGAAYAALSNILASL